MSAPSEMVSATGEEAHLTHWKLRFWSVFCGQASSLIGSALTQFVLLWWITDTTGSVSALAFAGLFALLPQALLGPLGGTLADRYSRRLLMIGSDLISAACMCVLIYLFLTEAIELWHAYTMMAVRSAMQAFQQPAAAASTAMLVPRHYLSRAAGLNQTLYGIMLVAAAPLGALAISVMPIGWALSIDVFTAVLGVVPLMIYAIPQNRPDAAERQGLWTEFKEGVATVWHNPGLKRLYALMAFVTLLVMPSFTLVPLLVKEHFVGGAGEVALMEGLAGAGMILGGGLVAVVAPKRKLAWVLVGFGLSCFMLALTAVMPGNMLLLAALWWALSSGFYILGNGPLTAMLQTIVPNRLQGRVLALLATVSGLAAPVGLALASPLGEVLGIRWLFVAMGVLGGVVAFAGFLSPTLRKVETSAVVE